MKKQKRTLKMEGKITPKSGIQLLRKLIEKAKEILKQDYIEYSVEEAWETIAESYVEKAFGKNSPNIEKVVNVGPGSYSMNASEEWWEGERRASFGRRVSILESLIEVLETEATLASTGAISSSESSHDLGTKIFIVHGHDDGVLNGVARYIEKLGLDAVVLHEKQNKGRTIIEKFEDECRGVGFAIILMTGDDRGGRKADTFEQQSMRARQNVILELGFFIGKLGRQRVLVLYEDGVEIPSDYNGVLFIKHDSAGSWKVNTAKEIKAASIDVDMNKAF